jgi:hypothetical protein
MAEQNATSVAITGGTIDNTVIGGTTPAAGTFTTLTATGQTSLGGVANAEGLRVLNTASATRYVQIEGSVSGQPRVQAAGATTPLALSGNGAQGLSFWSNSFATEQMRVAHTASAVNYVQVTGNATGSRPTISSQGSDSNIGLTISSKGNRSIGFSTNSAQNFEIASVASTVNYPSVGGSVSGSASYYSVVGSDTNISALFQSKGTGAIDLAAGSSGVNISNGGTVTAITRTAAGTGYTSVPTVNITAPTTAGGVQAVITIPSIVLASPSLSAGGTGYTVNDVLTLVGGTFTIAATLTVTAVSGGVITAVSITNNGVYTVAPSIPASVTGGTGTGATFNASFGINSNFSIGTAGSGYVEQPTVTFSGGGGSGAAAYATVGSGTTVKTIGSTLSFSTPSSEVLRIFDNSPSAQNYLQLESSGSGSIFRTAGASANPTFGFVNKGTGNFYFSTSNSVGNLQFNIAHTASAVNYVQVTGAATGASPTISVQGSDSNPNITLQSKGTGNVVLMDGGGNTGVRLLRAATSGDTFIDIQRNVGFVDFIAASGVSNGDIRFTPKGTGNVRFGTYTGTILTPTGYVEIKDSGGTVRRLLVG